MLGIASISSPVVSNMHNTQARSFDGSDQEVTIDNLVTPMAAAVKTNVTEFSISVWVKLSASISSSCVIFKCRNTGSTNNQITLIYHASGNEYRFTPKFGGTADVCNGGSTNASGASYEGDGIWHHLVGTVSVSDNTTEFWIDGTKKESIVGVGTLDETINAVYLCSGTGAGGNTWDGDMKDVAMWSRQLTDAEIAVLYNSGGPDGDKGLDLASGSNVSNAGLIAHFRFEEKFGRIAINDANADYNGVYVNDPAITTNIP